jgi:hydroxymethylpyrimidine pyrophosphatase-like HAD family hydrolase
MAEFTPLPEFLDRKCLGETPEGLLGRVELLATDMDGTLTQNGQFGPEVLSALGALQSSGLPVIIVTGRSAGWVSGLAQYLPVAGAICEDGGVVSCS